MQKQTPIEARTRQRTETRMERLARKPRPASRLPRLPEPRARPAGAAPWASSVVKW